MKCRTLLGCSLLALATACGGNDDAATADPSGQVRSAAIRNYAAIVHAESS